MRIKPVTEVFLHPGEWYFGDQDTWIYTLLGSCVSITLWHPQLKIGGMCHYLLASRGQHHNGPLSGRYADEAMLLLVREILQTERPLKEFQAKLTGGAAQLGEIEHALPAHTHDVAGRNIEMARSLTHQFGFSIQAEDLGGSHSRVVRFNINSGDLWIRQGPDHDVV